MARDSLLGGNFFQGLAEARGQDMRREREERERLYRRRNPSFGDMLKDTLKVQAASAIAQPIGTAIQDFVSSPFTEIRDNLIERESSRKGLIGQSRQINKTISTVQNDINTTKNSATKQGLDPITYKINEAKQELDSRFEKHFGPEWRANPEDLEERVALYNTLSGNITDMVTKDWNEKTQFIQSYGDRRFKSSEDVKSDLIKYNPNPKSIGTFLFRKGLSLFGMGKSSDEREVEAFQKAAPELYALINDDELLKQYELERDSAILTSNILSGTADKEELTRLINSKNKKAVENKTKQNMNSNFVSGEINANNAAYYQQNFPSLSNFIGLTEEGAYNPNKHNFVIEEIMKKGQTTSLRRVDNYFSSDSTKGVELWNSAQNEKRMQQIVGNFDRETLSAWNAFKKETPEEDRYASLEKFLEQKKDRVFMNRMENMEGMLVGINNIDYTKSKIAAIMNTHFTDEVEADVVASFNNYFNKEFKTLKDVQEHVRHEMSKGGDDGETKSAFIKTVQKTFNDVQKEAENRATIKIKGLAAEMALERAKTSLGTDSPDKIYWNALDYIKDNGPDATVEGFLGKPLENEIPNDFDNNGNLVGAGPLPPVATGDNSKSSEEYAKALAEQIKNAPSAITRSLSEDGAGYVLPPISSAREFLIDRTAKSNPENLTEIMDMAGNPEVNAFSPFVTLDEVSVNLDDEVNATANRHSIIIEFGRNNSRNIKNYQDIIDAIPTDSKDGFRVKSHLEGAADKYAGYYNELADAGYTHEEITGMSVSMFVMTPHQTAKLKLDQIANGVEVESKGFDFNEERYLAKDFEGGSGFDSHDFLAHIGKETKSIPDVVESRPTSGTLFDPELRRPLEMDKAPPADIDPDDYSFGPVAKKQASNSAAIQAHRRNNPTIKAKQRLISDARMYSLMANQEIDAVTDAQVEAIEAAQLIAEEAEVDSKVRKEMKEYFTTFSNIEDLVEAIEKLGLDPSRKDLVRIVGNDAATKVMKLLET